MLRRREFITLLGSVATALPTAAWAQSTSPVVGFLHGGSRKDWEAFLGGFHSGLREFGFIEGQNLAIEYRWADNRYDRLQEMAAGLVRMNVSAIFAGGAVRAAKAATSTIPIVFTVGEDPLKTKLVESLSRPGGNATGISLFFVELGAKRVELLLEIVPSARIFGLLLNPHSSQGIGRSTEAEQQEADVRAAVRARARELVVVHASSESSLIDAFAELDRQHANALIVASDIFFTTRRDQLVALATKYRMPTIYPWGDAVTAGGLMSYGIVLADSYRQAGSYVGRILKGAKPADLPVLQPTRLSFAINLKAAQALGLDVPATLLIRADEVVE